MNRLRWQLAMWLSALAWRIMPEPQRSRCYGDFQQTIAAIRAREG